MIVSSPPRVKICGIQVAKVYTRMLSGSRASLSGIKSFAYSCISTRKRSRVAKICYSDQTSPYPCTWPWMKSTAALCRRPIGQDYKDDGTVCAGYNGCAYCTVDFFHSLWRVAARHCRVPAVVLGPTNCAFHSLRKVGVMIVCWMQHRHVSLLHPRLA